MSWFEALQLALRLIATIAPIIGQLHVSADEPIDPTVLSQKDKQALADLHSHVNGS